MPHYKTILLDADNTLFDFSRAEREALTDALQTMGVKPTAEMTTVYSAINDSMWKKLERGEISKTALKEMRFTEFCAHYGVLLDVSALATAYTDFLSQKSHLIDGALEFCARLAEHCALYVITNGLKSVQQSRFGRSPLKPLFRAAFISEDLGFEKPRVEFFTEVARRIPDFSAETALVIGDSLSSDIQGGINAGIDTCWFNPSGKIAPAEMPITYTVASFEEILPLVLG